ncbi:MAG: hypothetical protein M1483_04320 [Actinobacteria bacterium]|nr:hypothetical protein [Actinomycetota bacterium]
MTIKSPLYCSSQCRQAAELVRYVRARRREGRDTHPDIVEVIEIKLAMVLGGGYPERERKVSEEIREVVFRRSGGVCEQCGCVMDFERKTGNFDTIPTVQHVTGNSNDLSNLKAFCNRCNVTDAKSRFVLVENGSPEAAMAEEISARCSAPRPLRLCDDENWKHIWQGLSSTARCAIRSPDK